jgi:hypothetical protein
MGQAIRKNDYEKGINILGRMGKTLCLIASNRIGFSWQEVEKANPDFWIRWCAVRALQKSG